MVISKVFARLSIWISNLFLKISAQWFEDWFYDTNGDCDDNSYDNDKNNHINNRAGETGGTGRQCLTPPHFFAKQNLL